MTVLRALDRRLMAPGSAHRLACVRVAVAVVLAVRLALRDWSDLADRPDQLFRPLGVIKAIPAMPPAIILVAVQAIGVAAALAATAGLVTRRRGVTVGLVVAWVALLVLAGLRSSGGKILHNDLLLLLGALPVVVAPAGAWLGDARRSRRWGWPVASSLLVVGVVYLATGLQKLAHGGLGWVTGDNLRWVLYWGADSGRAPTDTVALAIADRPWLCHTLAAGVILIELSAVLVLMSRRRAPWFVVAAIALHGGIWLTLGLDYWAWILTVAALALPWDRWFAAPSTGVPQALFAGASRPS